MEENLKLIIKAGTQKINPESTPSIINFVRPVKQRRQTISISNSKPSKNFLKENKRPLMSSRKEEKITLLVRNIY